MQIPMNNCKALLIFSAALQMAANAPLLVFVPCRLCRSISTQKYYGVDVCRRCAAMFRRCFQHRFRFAHVSRQKVGVTGSASSRNCCSCRSKNCRYIDLARNKKKNRATRPQQQKEQQQRQRQPRKQQKQQSHQRQQRQEQQVPQQEHQAEPQQEQEHGQQKKRRQEDKPEQKQDFESQQKQQIQQLRSKPQPQLQPRPPFLPQSQLQLPPQPQPQLKPSSQPKSQQQSVRQSLSRRQRVPAVLRSKAPPEVLTSVDRLRKVVEMQILWNSKWMKSVIIVGDFPMPDQLRLVNDGWKDMLILTLARCEIPINFPQLIQCYESTHRNRENRLKVKNEVCKLQAAIIQLRSLKLNMSEHKRMQVIVLLQMPRESVTYLTFGLLNAANDYKDAYVSPSVMDSVKLNSMLRQAEIDLSEYVGTTYPDQPQRYTSLMKALNLMKSVSKYTIERLLLRKRPKGKLDISQSLQVLYQRMIAQHLASLRDD